MFASTANVPTLGGGTVAHVSSLYREILRGVRDRRVESQAVPELFPLIRTIQQCHQYLGFAEAGEGSAGGTPVVFALPDHTQPVPPIE